MTNHELAQIAQTLQGVYIRGGQGFPGVELPTRDARGRTLCVGVNMDPSPDPKARFALYWDDTDADDITTEEIIGFYQEPADVVAAARGFNPDPVKPEHLSALWARVDDLGELIACMNEEFHPPGAVEEFDALRAVLRILDPAQSAVLDSLLGPDN